LRQVDFVRNGRPGQLFVLGLHYFWLLFFGRLFGLGGLFRFRGFRFRLLHLFHRGFLFFNLRGLFFLFNPWGIQVYFANRFRPGEFRPGDDHFILGLFLFPGFSFFFLFALQLKSDGLLFLPLLFAYLLGCNFFAHIGLELIEEYLIYVIGDLGIGPGVHIMPLGRKEIYRPVQ